ncbi:FkbM family methyltransferase [Rubrivirga sp. IMCC45206]|uniref:FkbM family methyltransferase n=1 Tax=Rubrivirga sp. IMCC45206 TaxID=3391614 RepID=UPI0039901BD2
MKLPIGRAHDLLRRVGYEVIPVPADRLLRRAPDVLLDVGANEGQFAASFRQRGFAGRIVSFEPVPAVFARLSAAAAADADWAVRNHALGAAPARLPMHVANHDASSSLLPPSDRMGEMADFLSFDATTEVDVFRLDDLFDELCRPGERVALKVDAQGYESAVLAGAQASLARIDAVQLELSFVPLYDGEPPAEAVMASMRERGFVPAFVAPAFVLRPSRQWLQADVLFLRDTP